jgi:ubiquinone/menaquinone biosynthesis C-methylase UbiE
MSRHLFDDHAQAYARTRPTYPDRLFDHLAALAPARDAVWDCGTGSGQAAVSLARRFATVVATDISRAQIAHAARGPRLHPVVAGAEQAPLRARSVDLVTVSAALHWFDRPRFYAEARRVARPGGVIAAWSYFHTRIAPELDPVIQRYADQTVAEFWIPQFDLNRRRYQGVDFPFERLPWPELEAEARMRLDDLLDFMRTWSASQAWQRAHGSDPVEQVREELARAWGDPATERPVRWPLHGAIGRVP